MRGSVRYACLSLVVTALVACGSSPPSGVDAAASTDADAAATDVSTADMAVTDVDAATDADADANADAAASDADGPDTSTDVASDADLPAGFFVVGDIDGSTWLATYNITPFANNFLAVNATVEPATDSAMWALNFTLPTNPVYPYTLECVSNYVELHEAPGRKFVSRTSTSYCNATFVAPTMAGTVEGTFSGNLRLSGTTQDFPLTNGRFRLPIAQ